MEIIRQPDVEVRPLQPYVGIRMIAPFSGMSRAITQMSRELRQWQAEQAVVPAGPPFLRYHVIDMRGAMDLTFAVPVSEARRGRGRVKAGQLPAGHYAHLVYVNGGIAGNKALLEWIRAEGLKMDRRTIARGDAFHCRYETYLTDPRVEPRRTRWEIEVAIKLTGLDAL